MDRAMATGSWQQHQESYKPGDVEQFLMTELGVTKHAAMMLAVGKPDLSSLDVATQVKPSVKSLKDANIAPEDIWFLVTRKPHLLSAPTVLSRWLDFLSVYSVLTPRDVSNFLLRAPDALLSGNSSVTLYSAGQMVMLLKKLGLKDDFLAQRVLCLWPAVLARDVEQQLRPIVLFLLNIGVEVSDIARLVAAWPELLLCEVSHLQRWADHLRQHLGCSTVHVAEVIMACPHLLGFQADEVFKVHVASLSKLGIGKEEMARMCSKTTKWMTSPGGIAQQVDFLLSHWTPEQARELVLAEPSVLAEKESDLQHKFKFLTSDLAAGVTSDEIAACPAALALGYQQALGPRFGFLKEHGKLPAAGPGGTSDGHALALLRALCHPPDDVEWCAGLGLPAMDFSRFRALWEEDYTQTLVQNSALEFQEELKRLGIYEGQD